MPNPVNIRPETEEAPKIKAEKGPSKFFTEYYTAVFLLLLAAIIGAAVFFLLPLITGIKDTNAQTSAQVAAAEEERRYLSTLEQSVAAAQSIPQATLDQVNTALPPETQVPSILTQIAGAAARNNVRLDSISVTDAAITPTVQAGKPASGAQIIAPVNISLNVRSMGYLDIKRFLADVESNLRIMDIISITSSASSGELIYTLQIRTYTFLTAAPSTEQQPTASPGPVPQAQTTP